MTAVRQCPMLLSGWSITRSVALPQLLPPAPAAGWWCAPLPYPCKHNAYIAPKHGHDQQHKHGSSSFPCISANHQHTVLLPVCCSK